MRLTALSRCWVRDCLKVRRSLRARGPGLCSGRGGPAGAGDMLPDGEAEGHLGAVAGGWIQVAAGRKCGEMLLNADRNRCAPPAERKPFIACSRCRVDWWLFPARLLRYFDCRCLTEGILAVGRSVGAELVGDDHPGHRARLLEQLSTPAADRVLSWWLSLSWHGGHD